MYVLLDSTESSKHGAGHFYRQGRQTGIANISVP